MEGQHQAGEAVGAGGTAGGAAPGTGGAPVVARRAAAPGTGRQRVAALICLVMAAVMAATAVIGMGRLTTLQVALDFAAAVVWLLAGWLLARRGTRWPAVTMGWLTAAGMLVELGSYQSRRNGTSTLAASSDTYFLPGLVWLYLFGLIVVAIAVGVLSKRQDRTH